MRARDLGIPFDGNPGTLNAITDVEGVLIGHCTIIKGDGKLIVGKGPVRTGVTAIFPYGINSDEVYAGYYSYNGNGEMTGTIWIDEAGRLKGPICITNTHSVGIVRDAVIEWSNKMIPEEKQIFWRLPVIAETYDGLLNDINGFHIKKEHVFAALDSAEEYNVMEGNVGGGTGMICHQFKGGIGTSSRILPGNLDEFKIGVLVQANYGSREHLTIAGVPVGKEIIGLMPKLHFRSQKEDSQSYEGPGSIIAIIATDAPLLPYQLKRITKRVPAGLARVGGYGSNSSGDIFLAFSTGNIKEKNPYKQGIVDTVNSLRDEQLSSLFKATAEATEEAIINALVSAETMKGIEDNTVYALPHDELKTILRKYNRINE